MHKCIVHEEISSHQSKTAHFLIVSTYEQYHAALMLGTLETPKIRRQLANKILWQPTFCSCDNATR